MSHRACWVALSIGGAIICLPSGNVESLASGMYFTGLALFVHWLGNRKSGGGAHA